MDGRTVGLMGGPEGAQAVGNVHTVVESEADAFGAIAAFMSYLLSIATSPAPVASAVAPLADPADLPSVVPAARRSAYDMRRVLEAIADRDSLFPWAARWGPSLITAPGATRDVIARALELAWGSRDRRVVRPWNR